MPDIQSHPVFLTPRRLQTHLPLFVFLPGMDGTGQLLRTQTEGLEAAFDVRCLAIPPDDLNRWTVLADQVIALTRAELAETPDRPVYLCGESFGGCLALQTALQAPDLYDRLILINPASSFRVRPWIAWGTSLSRWLPEFAYTLSTVLLLPLLANLERIPGPVRSELIETVRSVPQKTSVWRLSLLHEFDVTAMALDKLTQPVLLIGAAHDRLLPSLAEIRRLAPRFAQSRVVVLPQSGHACLLEAEVNLYEILQAHDFLISSAPQASLDPAQVET